MSTTILSDRVLDFGLSVLDTEATHIEVCTSQPTTYVQATTAYNLGFRSYSAGSIFGAPQSIAGGRRVVATLASDGIIDGAGPAGFLAVTDRTNSRLLAVIQLDTPVPVTMGGAFAFSGQISLMSGGPTYQGPGDLVSGWNSWYGFRAFSAATAGVKPCCKILRFSDSVKQDFGTLPDGSFDIAAATTFLTSTTGYIHTMYDQVADRHSQTGQDIWNSDMPRFAFNLIGSRPGMNAFDGNARMYTAVFTAEYSAPFGGSVVMKKVGTAHATYGGGGLVLGGAMQIQFGNLSTPNKIGYYNAASGTVWDDATDGVLHDVNVRVYSGDNYVCIDGVDHLHTNTGAWPMQVGEVLQMPAYSFFAHWFEAGWGPMAYGASDRAAIAANQAAYYGHR